MLPWLATLATAHPTARTPAFPELADAVSEAEWDEAEAAARRAFAAELEAIDAPAPLHGFGATAAALDEHLGGTAWTLRRYEHVVDASLARGDHVAALAASDAAAAVEGRTRWGERFAIAAWRARQAAPVVGWPLLAGLLAFAVGRALRRLGSTPPAAGVSAVAGNPFTAGGPVHDAVGRDALVADLASRERSVCLLGPRFSGRSTVLAAVRRRLVERLDFPIDLSAADAGGHALVARLREGLGAAGEPYRPGEDPSRIARRLAKRGRVVVLIDDADGLEHASAAALDALRRTCLTPKAPARFVAASERWQPDRVDAVELGPLDLGGAAALMTRLRWEGPVLQEVLRRCEGQPMLLQLYGSELWIRRRDEPVRAADLDAAEAPVRAAWTRLRDADRPPVREDTVATELRDEVARLTRQVAEVEDELDEARRRDEEERAAAEAEARREADELVADVNPDALRREEDR